MRQGGGDGGGADVGMDAGRPREGGSSHSHGVKESNIILRRTHRHTNTPVTSPACKRPVSVMTS